MSGTCSMHKIFFLNMNRRDNLRDLIADGKIILKFSLKKYGMRV